MKFRVERDALADAVAWTAKSLPSRPVGAGARRGAAAGRRRPAARSPASTTRSPARSPSTCRPTPTAPRWSPAGCSPRSPRRCRPSRSRSPRSARTSSWSAAAPGSPCRPCRSRTTRRCRRCRPDAGTVDAGDVRRRGRPGRHRRRPRRHAADAHRRPAGDRAARRSTLLATDRYRLAVREIDLAPGRPGASASHALVPARTLADTAKTLGPLGGEVTVALSRGGVGEGMIGFAGGTRRTTSRLLDGRTSRRSARCFPDQLQRPGPGAASPRSPRSSSASRWSPSGPPRCGCSFSRGRLVVEAGGSEDARASEAMECDVHRRADDDRVQPAVPARRAGRARTPRPPCCRSPTPKKPAVIIARPATMARSSPGYRYLIMPVRDRRLTRPAHGAERRTTRRETMQLGLVGLGRMGGNMRERLRAAGHEVVGYDRNPEISDVARPGRAGRQAGRRRGSSG